MNSTTTVPTPLGLSRVMRRPLVAAGQAPQARAPLAALVMRVAFDRVVLWTACIDDRSGDLRVLSGRVELTQGDSDEAPGTTFKLAAVQALPELANALRQAAADSPAGFIELAIPNATLRALAHEVAEALGPAQVLSSNEIVRLPAVDRAVAEADARYAEVLAGQITTQARNDTDDAPPADVLVATDASVRRRRAPAAAAWVRPDGMFDTQLIDTADIAVAELAAITAAIEAHSRHRGGLTVRSDSREAIAMATSALAGGIDGRTAAARRYQRRIVASPIRQAVRLEWVKGHRGDRLNETADALAVMARRHHDAGVTPAEHRVRARGEVFAMLTPPIDAAPNG